MQHLKWISNGKGLYPVTKATENNVLPSCKKKSRSVLWQIKVDSKVGNECKMTEIHNIKNGYVILLGSVKPGQQQKIFSLDHISAFPITPRTHNCSPTAHSQGLKHPALSHHLLSFSILDRKYWVGNLGWRIQASDSHPDLEGGTTQWRTGLCLQRWANATRLMRHPGNPQSKDDDKKRANIPESNCCMHAKQNTERG